MRSSWPTPGSSTYSANADSGENAGDSQPARPTSKRIGGFAAPLHPEAAATTINKIEIRTRTAFRLAPRSLLAPHQVATGAARAFSRRARAPCAARRPWGAEPDFV